MYIFACVFLMDFEAMQTLCRLQQEKKVQKPQSDEEVTTKPI